MRIEGMHKKSSGLCGFHGFQTKKKVDVPIDRKEEDNQHNDRQLYKNHPNVAINWCKKKPSQTRDLWHNHDVVDLFKALKNQFTTGEVLNPG